MWRAADFRIGVAYALSNLGRVAYRAGRLEEAEGLLERARDAFRQMAADAELVETDARRAECLLLQGLPADALVLADDAGRPRPHARQRHRGADAAADARVRPAAARRPRRRREALEHSLAGARELDACYDVAITLDALVRLSVGETGIVDVAARHEADELFTLLGVVRAPEVPLTASAGRDQARVGT